ncbi:siderophore-interacting protein [Pseudolabrys sp.]|uniref:siderophore-interacting protein n=1 Tax=Pseudolabrys sp. TaxID=1960880 RepID=UPI003D104FE3
MRRPRLVDVRAVQLITPCMKRVRLGGDDLEGFAPTRPAQWVKLFVPANQGHGQAGRVYTIRNYSPERRELDLEFVIHGDGPASWWAQHARAGQCVRLAGPRAGYERRADTEWMLLFGDETALPAIFSILESLPAGFPVQAFLEVMGPDDERYASKECVKAGLDLHWLHRHGAAAGTTRLLYEAATEVRLPSGFGELWVAAEARAVHDVKTHFMVDRSVERSRIHASGYWKHGVADHRNSVS